MMELENNIDVLTRFLQCSLYSSTEIFDIFQTEFPQAIVRGTSPSKFLYIEGTRKDKVLMVAHCDTAHFVNNYFKYKMGLDKYKVNDERNLNISICDDIIVNRDKNILGADDRAGVAIIWLLRHLGHSILLTDGEECGMMGSRFIIDENPDIVERLKKHMFIVQFDRQGANQFKTYDVGTEKFQKYINDQTGYVCQAPISYTDICTLAPALEIQGCNMSVGYVAEHTFNEYLVINDWLNTLNISRAWLRQKNLPKYNLGPNKKSIFSKIRGMFTREPTLDDFQLDFDCDFLN